MIHFHSDGSVNDWGWKMYIRAEGNSNAAQQLIPAVRGLDLDGEDAIRCYSLLSSLVIDGVGFPERQIYDQLSQFKRRTKGKTISPLQSLRTSTEIQSQEEKEENVIRSKADLRLPSFRSIQRPDDVLISLVDLKVYEEATVESKLLDTLPLGQKVFVVEECENWVRVKLSNDTLTVEDMGKVEPKGWVMRRKNDEYYLDFDQTTVFVEEITETPDISNSKNSSESAPLNINPMYEVSNGSREKNVEGNTKNYSANRLVFRDYDFIQQAMCDYAVIASISYSQSALQTLFNTWPADLSLKAFNLNMEDILTYLNEMVGGLNRKNLGEKKFTQLKHQCKKLLDLFLQEKSLSNQPDPLHVLLTLSQDILENCSRSTSNKYDGKIPVKRGRVQIVESSHPYENSLNKDWTIKFPGCKKIELKFSPESCTETNYDYITIYDLSKEKKLYPTPIHGFKSAANRHFPGVNCPSAIIETDSCVVNFTTDSGTNDWGFKLFAYGIYEYPDESEILAYKAFQSDIADKKTRDQSIRFALWVFSELSTAETLDSSARFSLFDIKNFQVLITFYNSPLAEAYKTNIMEIFVTFIQFYSTKLSALSESFISNLFSDLKELEFSLIRSSNSTYNSVTDNGANLHNIPTEFQATLQLLITIGSFISKLENSSTFRSLLNNKALRLQPISTGENADWETFVAPVSSRTKALVCWDIKLTSLLSGDKLPVVGITPDISSLRNGRVGENNLFEIGITHGSILVNNQAISFAEKAKKWSAGDVISLIFDRVHGVLYIAVNQVLCPIVAGPPKFQPALEVNLVNLDAYLVVSLPTPANNAEVEIYPNNWIANKFNLGSAESSAVNQSGTDWLSSLNDLSVLLHDISNSRIPHSILTSKFLPICNKKSAKHLKIQFNAENQNFPSEEVNFRGTSAQVVLVVEQLQLFTDDKVEIFDEKNNLVLTLTAADNRPKPAFENLDRFIQDVTSKYLDKSNLKYKSALSSLPGSKNIAIGDRVVRSANWKYGNEDGGLGSVGTITKIQEWKGKSANGLSVRWENGYENLYRYNYDGVSDVELLRETSYLKKTKGVVASNGTWHTESDFLKVVSSRGPNTSDRSVKLLFVPILYLESCLENSEFEGLKHRLTKLYVPSKRGHYSELVNHINSVARKKSIEREELLLKKWSDLTPTAEDFIRSALLKELSELDSINLLEGESFSVEGFSASDTLLATYEDTPVDPELLTIAPEPVDGYLAEYAYWNGIYDFDDLESACLAAKQIYPECRGITLEQSSSKYTLRRGRTILPSETGEKSWVLTVKSTANSAQTLIPENHLGVVFDDNNYDGSIKGNENEETENNEDHPEDWQTVSESGSDQEGKENSDNSLSGEEDEQDDLSSEEEGEDDELGSEGEDEHVVSGSGEEDENEDHLFESDSQPDQTSDAADRKDTQAANKEVVCGKCDKPIFRHNPGTWGNGWSCYCPDHVGANSFLTSDAVWGCETIMDCNWGLCKTCWQKFSGKTGDQGAVIADNLQSQFSKAEMKPAEAAYNVVILLNFLVKKCIPFIDLNRNENNIPGSLSALLFSNRDLILEAVKKPVFEESLTRTEAKGGQFELRLNRVRAIKFFQAGKCDEEGKWSVFAQAFRAIHPMPPATMRRSDKLYTVKLLGERAQVSSSRDTNFVF